jgi:hypothetical protein
VELIEKIGGAFKKLRLAILNNTDDCIAIDYEWEFVVRTGFNTHAGRERTSVTLTLHHLIDTLLKGVILGVEHRQYVIPVVKVEAVGLAQCSGHMMPKERGVHQATPQATLPLTYGGSLMIGHQLTSVHHTHFGMAPTDVCGGGVEAEAGIIPAIGPLSINSEIVPRQPLNIPYVNGNVFIHVFPFGE